MKTLLSASVITATLLISNAAIASCGAVDTVNIASLSQAVSIKSLSSSGASYALQISPYMFEMMDKYQADGNCHRDGAVYLSVAKDPSTYCDLVIEEAKRVEPKVTKVFCTNNIQYRGMFKRNSGSNYIMNFK